MTREKNFFDDLYDFFIVLFFLFIASNIKVSLNESSLALIMNKIIAKTSIGMATAKGFVYMS